MNSIQARSLFVTDQTAFRARVTLHAESVGIIC